MSLFIFQTVQKFGEDAGDTLRLVEYLLLSQKKVEYLLQFQTLIYIAFFFFFLMK